MYMKHQVHKYNYQMKLWTSPCSYLKTSQCRKELEERQRKRTRKVKLETISQPKFVDFASN